jgi:hypothetical protein
LDLNTRMWPSSGSLNESRWVTMAVSAWSMWG